MAGVKRTFANMDHNGDKSTSLSPYLAMFEKFREELDEHHDRRDRIGKASRDITAYSKKIIFSLQRTKDFGTAITDKRVLAEVSKLQKQTSETFESIAADLKLVNAYRYQRNISPGIQELMEAVLFQRYLETQKIMTYEDAAAQIPSGVMLTYEDYALGVFDMTGELMKIAITYMATNGKLPGADQGTSVLSDMQTMRTQLELLNTGGSYALAKEFDSKLKTTKASVEKVEASVYNMTVRGSERPPGWKPDVETGTRGGEEVESY